MPYDMLTSLAAVVEILAPGTHGLGEAKLVRGVPRRGGGRLDGDGRRRRVLPEPALHPSVAQINRRRGKLQTSGAVLGVARREVKAVMGYRGQGANGTTTRGPGPIRGQTRCEIL